MNYIALFSAAILFFAICASEAEARKFRLFSISGLDGGETIDPVYNLPNTATFLREGKTFDLGYLNSGDGGGYVLYHGDRYARLSEADIARLKVTLGFDPTTKHRTEQAGRTAVGVWRSWSPCWRSALLSSSIRGCRSSVGSGEP